MKVLLFVLLAGLAAESSAAIFCKEVNVLDLFKLKEFAGDYYQTWFFSDVQRVAPTVFGKCTRQTYKTIEQDEDKLFITNSQIDSKGKTVISNGYAVYKDPAVQNGLIKVVIYQGLLTVTIEYNVLVFRPGKSGYIIVYSCVVGVRSGWVLTKEKVPSAETRKLIEEDKVYAFKNGGPSPQEYKETPQTGCPD